MQTFIVYNPHSNRVAHIVASELAAELLAKDDPNWVWAPAKFGPGGWKPVASAPFARRQIEPTPWQPPAPKDEKCIRREKRFEDNQALTNYMDFFLAELRSNNPPPPTRNPRHAAAHPASPNGSTKPVTSHASKRGM